jgi:glycosyltransferase involved in cell wall biosynthesis
MRILTRRHVPRLIARNWLSPHALMHRRTWSTFGYREDLRAVEDLDLWLRLLLADERVAVLGEPGVLVREGRPGSLSGKTALMRRSRRRVFLDLWRQHKLSGGERFVVAYQLLRTSAGVKLANDAPLRPGRAIHVYLDDDGGGPRHVAMLVTGVASRMSCVRMPLRPSDATGVGVVRTAARIVSAADQASVIHAHGLRAAAVCVPAVVIRRRHFVITMHGLHAIRAASRRTWFPLHRWILRRADRVLVFTESDVEALSSRRFVEAARIVRIRPAFVARPSAIGRAEARRRLDIMDGSLAVAWVGRLSPEKDPATFVRAVHMAARTREIVGLLAGEGPLRDRLPRVPAVRRLGWVNDPATLLAAADVFVSTSRWEGMPLAVLEAAAAGLPLILSDVPGNRDVVDLGVEAVFVPSADPAALAAALVALQPSTTGRVVDETLGSLTPDALAEDVLAVYHDIA